MNEIRLEQKIILTSTQTICNLFDYENWADLVALYMFYHKQCKLQKTNQSFTTSNFVMQWLRWGRDRFAKAKNLLTDLWLVEDISDKWEDWKIKGWYIKLNYIESTDDQNILDATKNHPTDLTQCGSQRTNAWSTKGINAWSDKGSSHIEEKTSTEKSKPKRSSSIRKVSEHIRAIYVPPTKLMVEERLGQKRWVDKFYEILTLEKMKDPLSLDNICELYDWTIQFFQEKYDGKIYKDSNTGKMIWAEIIFNEFDKFISHYSEKWDDILCLKARLRKWITNSLKYAN